MALSQAKLAIAANSVTLMNKPATAQMRGILLSLLRSSSVMPSLARPLSRSSFVRIAAASVRGGGRGGSHEHARAEHKC